MCWSVLSPFLEHTQITTPVSGLTFFFFIFVCCRMQVLEGKFDEVKMSGTMLAPATNGELIFFYGGQDLLMALSLPATYKMLKFRICCFGSDESSQSGLTIPTKLITRCHAPWIAFFCRIFSTGLWKGYWPLALAKETTERVLFLVWDLRERVTQNELRYFPRFNGR